MHGKAQREPTWHSVVLDCKSCHYITGAKVCLLSCYNVHAPCGKAGSVSQCKNRALSKKSPTVLTVCGPKFT